MDDTTTTVCDHSSAQSQSPTTLLHQIESDLQNWSNLLHLSGGALKFSKTELFLVQWKFNDNGIPYLSQPTDSRSITLTSPTCSRTHTILSRSALKSYKLLGFHLSPSLSMNKQYHVLHEKSHKLANAIAGSSITRSEAYTVYFALYLPAVLYVLILTSFSPKQCHHIQYPGLTRNLSARIRLGNRLANQATARFLSRHSPRT